MDPKNPGSNSLDQNEQNPNVSDPKKIHTVVVNMDRDSRLDPLFIINYPSFKMTPLVAQSGQNSSGNEVVDFTLVGQIPDPEDKPGSSNR
jgi:hypothetical protein